jgi:hypothetical protein
MGWTQRNLATDFGAPRALFGPAAYLFVTKDDSTLAGIEITRHVIYLEADASGQSTGIIREGFCAPDDHWHFKNLINEANAPHAVSAPTAYAFEAEETQHVLYRAAGDSHIHELYWKDGDGWKHSDLMTNTSGGAPDIFGQAFGAFGWEAFAGQKIVYMGVDRLVHLLSRGSDGNAHWSHQALTKSGDPPCAVPPGGYGSTTAGTLHVNYRSDDHRLYEIVANPQGEWGSPIDMGAGLNNVPDAIDDQHRGFTDEGSGIRYVNFLGADFNIYEYSFISSWKLTNLTQSSSAPLAIPGFRPAPYMFPPTQDVPVATQHSIYVGADAKIQELWRFSGDTWNSNPLTDVIRGMLLNSPSAFVDTVSRISTQNVFLANAIGQIIELRWKIDGSRRRRPPGRHHG